MILATRIDPKSEEFQNNAARMRDMVDDLNGRLARVAHGGDEESRR